MWCADREFAGVQATRWPISGDLLLQLDISAEAVAAAVSAGEAARSKRGGFGVGGGHRRRQAVGQGCQLQPAPGGGFTSVVSADGSAVVLKARSSAADWVVAR